MSKKKRQKINWDSVKERLPREEDIGHLEMALKDESEEVQE